MNFAVLWLFVKFFSTKFGDVVCPLVQQSEQSTKVFFTKIVFLPIRKVFSVESFPLYGISCAMSRVVRTNDVHSL